jgi:hypothetical protein
MALITFPLTKKEIERKYGFELDRKEPYDPKEFVDILSRLYQLYLILRYS